MSINQGDGIVEGDFVTLHWNGKIYPNCKVLKWHHDKLYTVNMRGKEQLVLRHGLNGRYLEKQYHG